MAVGRDGRHPVFGAVADDLTGGMELAAMLVSHGVDCAFVVGPDGIPDAAGADAIVVALKTRVISPADAVAAVGGAARALLAAGVQQLFFKYCATFDSTDEGNIGPCAERLMALTGAPFTLFCPSFPEAGRRVFQGHLFAGDRLVSESPKRFDPLTPMTDPDLVRVLQRQSTVRVGLLPHEVQRAGLDAMRAHVSALTADGIRFAIADAAMPEDLARLAALTADWPLMTGNSSIAEYYPAQWYASGRLARAAGDGPDLPAVDGPGVVLAGSCAERTLDQLAVFGRTRPVLRIDMARALAGDDLASEAVAWAGGKLGEGPVAIATSADPDTVARLQAMAGRQAVAWAAETLLAEIAWRLREAGVRRFVISGGETSGTILDRLGIRRLRVGPYEGPGIARAVTMEERPLALSLKSGKLGPDDMLVPMLEAMRQPRSKQGDDRRSA